MADLIGEKLQPVIRSGDASQGFRNVTDINSIGLPIGRNESTGLDDVLESVASWEYRNKDLVTHDEQAALSVLKTVLNIFPSFNNRETRNLRDAMLTSIKMEQKVLQVVFSNLDENGKPNERIERSFNLVSSVFENYLALRGLKAHYQVAGNFGIWRGIKGAVTTALMFNSQNWEVRLPPPLLDLNADVDLIVGSPFGQLYAVDITSKWRQFRRQADIYQGASYFTEEARVDPAVSRQVKNLNGSFRINIPPSGHIATAEFYENEAVGYPSSWVLKDFGQKLNKLASL